MRRNRQLEKMRVRTEMMSRLLSEPESFTFEELELLLSTYGCYHQNHHYLDYADYPSDEKRQSTEYAGEDYIRLHKPTGREILKPYQIEALAEFLKDGEGQ